jgi:hypothetical protein
VRFRSKGLSAAVDLMVLKNYQQVKHPAHDATPTLQI